MTHKYIFSLFFVVFVSFIGYKNIQINYLPMKNIILTEQYNTITNKIEKEYDTTFFSKYSTWNQVYGIWHRILLKNEYNYLATLKDKAGFLHSRMQLPDKPYPEGYFTTFSKNLTSVYDYIKTKNIYFLYIQAPSDYILGKTEFPYGVQDYTNQNIDAFMEKLAELSIPFLDTRPLFENMPIEDIFYKTDHHWAFPASFKTFQEIAKQLETRYNLILDENNIFTNPEHYTHLISPNQFTGSAGRGIGNYYTNQKDSFKIYYPKFETNFTYKLFHNSKLTVEVHGEFKESLVSQKFLNHPSHRNNQYAAMLHAIHAEGIIINHLASNKLKCLVIGDSFTFPVVPYLSLLFSETRLLNPRENHSSYNFLEYINEFQPDIVLVLFNGLNVYTIIPIEKPS